MKKYPSKGLHMLNNELHISYLRWWSPNEDDYHVFNEKIKIFGLKYEDCRYTVLDESLFALFLLEYSDELIIKNLDE